MTYLIPTLGEKHIMKRSLIALGVASALVAPIANAAPKVYGKLNLSVEQYEKDNQNPATADSEYSRTQSNASRFGLKGEDELTADLSAVYLLEFGVDGDQGLDVCVKSACSASSDKTNIEKITQRNRFVGIKSATYGTVKIGKYDTYTKLAQGEVDLFNDFFGDMEYVIAGENRVDNVVGYESPKIADAVQVSIMTQTQEAATGAKNGSSASVVFNDEEAGLYLALAMDHNVWGKTALSSSVEGDNLRLVAGYKVADLSLSAVYSQFSVADNGSASVSDEAGWQVGVSYKLGSNVLKAQYGIAEADDADNAILERTLWSVGVDHNLTSKTKAFVWYTTKEEDKLAANADTQETSLALGLEHKF